ncbi:uncharacterized protein EV422DRAFT_508354 [Fimicolochytrium jonesii]|uniref:uncharacterized protein n=1 Tax=Fimicolochytrium jonesii TaxID=1396493 RepID=UPI0022FEBFBF|nr:uncharacterized protein EV422DRAFT_508354 [Fimicolochytrium jonesii]KAI8818136.1 hypothetical protein EV422DRAFT_508354 [Fimicolochytrium jonesii]
MIQSCHWGCEIRWLQHLRPSGSLSAKRRKDAFSCQRSYVVGYLISQPLPTSEATFTTRYVWPWLGLIKKGALQIELDVLIENGVHRPDVHISQTRRYLQQTLVQAEIKTKTAPEAEKQKETARVIEKVMQSYRSEVEYSYNGLEAPKLAICIQGTRRKRTKRKDQPRMVALMNFSVSYPDTQVKVYHVFSFAKMFVSYFAGSLQIMTQVPEGDKGYRRIINLTILKPVSDLRTLWVESEIAEDHISIVALCK